MLVVKVQALKTILDTIREFVPLSNTQVAPLLPLVDRIAAARTEIGLGRVVAELQEVLDSLRKARLERLANRAREAAEHGCNHCQG